MLTPEWSTHLSCSTPEPSRSSPRERSLFILFVYPNFPTGYRKSYDPIVGCGPSEKPNFPEYHRRRRRRRVLILCNHSDSYECEHSACCTGCPTLDKSGVLKNTPSSRMFVDTFGSQTGVLVSS